MNAIEKSSTLGFRIRQRREELGLTVQDIAREVKISPHYVRALEEGDYALLAAKVYAYGFLKKILALLAVEERTNWVEQFDVEWDVWMKKKDKNPVSLAKEISRGSYITPGRFFLGIGAALLIAFLLFAAAQIKNFTGRPSLIIEAPSDKTEVSRPTIEVKGRTEKESRLTVNGREITIDGSGNFREEIQLLAGINELVFAARNRFGKETKEIRYVVVR